MVLSGTPFHSATACCSTSVWAIRSSIMRRVSWNLLPGCRLVLLWVKMDSVRATWETGCGTSPNCWWRPTLKLVLCGLGSSLCYAISLIVVMIWVVEGREYARTVTYMFRRWVFWHGEISRLLPRTLTCQGSFWVGGRLLILLLESWWDFFRSTFIFRWSCLRWE